MTRYILCPLAFLLLYPCLVHGEEQKPVFPGAKGFGVETPAGRGGDVVRVTTLDPTGPGSLNEALLRKGPRIVVFEVGGVIDLGKRNLYIVEPFLTLAGQTAPSPGITLIRGGLNIATHDVLIQHIRVRPGDAGAPKRSGWEPDGISSSGASACNIVIDHCSISWAVDENLSASGPRHEGREGTSRNITFSRCIIAEGLNDSSHAKGPHSKGSLIHDHCTRIAVIGNLYASNVQRNPMFKPDASGVVVNNVIYNPGSRAVHFSWPLEEYEGQPEGPRHARVAVVGNVLFYGPDTRDGTPLVDGKADVFIDENIMNGREGKNVPLATGAINRLENRPLWPEGLEPLPAGEVVKHVIANAGARPKDRDAVDRRIIKGFLDKTGRIISSQDEVGGYPKEEKTERKLDVPEESVEAWLARYTAEVER